MDRVPLSPVHGRPDLRTLLHVLVSLGALLTFWILTGAQPEGQRDVVGYTLYLPVFVVATWIMFRSVRTLSKSAQRGWRMMGAAMFVYLLGEVTYAFLDVTGAVTFPSVADVFYLAFIPLFAVALTLFPREQPTKLRKFGFVLDLGLAVTTFGSILWVTTGLSDTLARFQVVPLDSLLSLAYPATDLLLLSVMLIMMMWRARGISRTQLLLLTIGMALYLAADLGYSYQEHQGAYQDWGVIDLLWTWGFVFFAWAAYAGTRPAPRVRRLTDQLLPRFTLPYTRLRTLVPHLVISASYALFMYLHLSQPLTSHSQVMMTLVTLLLLARQVISFLDNHLLSHDLTHNAQTDELTGLPNRQAITGMLNRTIDRADRQGLELAVLFIGLDRMKYVNDWRGHEQGDRVLRETSRRLMQLLRAEDTLGRFSGDEFVVILPHLQSAEHATETAERLLGAIACPVSLDGDAVYITASAGIAVCPRHAGEAELALHFAYTAMQQAKQRGRNKILMFQEGQTSERVHEGKIESQIRTAWHNNEFKLHYQPIVRVCDEQVIGFEALARWTSASLGDLSPSEVIRVAEERGLIIPLGEWALEQAARQVKRWRATIHPSVYVSVNVSALQFRHEEFIHDVQRVLRDHDLPGNALLLELTETHLMEDVRASVSRIEQLRRLGVRIALDDFGTGYSSLGTLRELPVDVLKIDRCFLRNMNARGETFLQAVVTLGRTLELNVIVEGVETSAQRDLLRRFGCDAAQGFYFARPASPGAVEAQFEALVELLIEQGSTTH